MIAELTQISIFSRLNHEVVEYAHGNDLQGIGHNQVDSLVHMYQVLRSVLICGITILDISRLITVF